MNRTERFKESNELLHKALPHMLYSKQSDSREYVTLLSELFTAYATVNDILFDKTKRLIQKKLNEHIDYDMYQTRYIKIFQNCYLSFEERLVQTENLEERVDKLEKKIINKKKVKSSIGVNTTNRFSKLKCPTKNCGNILVKHTTDYNVQHVMCKECHKRFPLKDNDTFYLCKECGKPLSGIGKHGSCINCKRMYILETMEQFGTRVMCKECGHKWIFKGKGKNIKCTCGATCHNIQQIEIPYDTGSS